MQLKKLSAFALLLLSFSAVAEVPLTKADLLGTWQIEKESVSSDGLNAKPLNTTWSFREDGTMEGIAQDTDAHARIDSLRAILNYSVEGGKLVKQAAAGRSKMETCVAFEKESNRMVLKCQTVYFFMTKK